MASIDVVVDPPWQSVHKELLSDIGARFYAATDAAPDVGDVFLHLAPVRDFSTLVLSS